MAVGPRTAILGVLIAGTPAGVFVNNVSQEHGIPTRAVVAYVSAAQLQGCDWRDIAAVGWREAGHGTYDGRHLDEETGVLTPALDKWDGWAMGGGPMGFLRPTWEGGGYADQFPGDGDGGYQDMDAAAQATCQYLRAKGYEVGNPEARWAALKSYNGTGPMADNYANEALAYADALPPLGAAGVPAGVQPTKAQAEALGGSGRRSLGDTIEAGWQALLSVVDKETAEHSPEGPLRAGLDWLAPGTPDSQELPRGASTSDPAGGGGSAAAKLGDVSGIQVAAGMERQLRSLVDAAARDGVTLVGSGWRSQEEQIHLRQVNGCPDIWDAPAEECETPTARPGRSQHEVGLAVDFQDTPGAWAWLAENVEEHGLELGVPGEPWHVNVPAP